MSDCRVPMPNYQPVEQATIRRMCRQFGEPPWTYQLDKPECWPDEAVQFVDAVEFAGVRFERVRECELTPVKDYRVSNIVTSWGCVCSSCGGFHEFNQGKYWNFCPNCGAKVKEDADA